MARQATDLPEFTFEFTSEIESIDEQMEEYMREEAESRLRKLQGGKSDMVGAAATIERLAHGETAHLFRARVVVYIRPENIAAEAKQDNPRGALKEALSAVERQVRNKRERMRTRYRQP